MTHNISLHCEDKFLDARPPGKARLLLDLASQGALLACRPVEKPRASGRTACMSIVPRLS
uniref:Uncharacterized protein n=1 Tax=Anguilla anguilla TaxID=7936 RepID=A0A0E9X3Y1_ANGAN